MLFDTPVYFLFLAIVVVVYWRLVDRKRQNWFLLAASYLFYGWWDWRFLLLMMGSTTVDYLVSRKIAASENPVHRKALLTFSLFLNFGFLAFFKYFHFFADSLSRALMVFGAGPSTIQFIQIVLPPGISFYTFQEVAYILDVYFRKLEPAESFTDLALFISLFPHLIAGPIQRPSHLLPQVQHARRLDPDAFFDGCMLIVSGLFRKCVLADQCALIANASFDGRMGRGFWATTLGAVAFAFQIYCDFSAYSDFARGSAQLLGFHFMVNFRQPYLATSLQDFWRRWHISLSTWLRDYLYIPLGGNRHGELKTYRNLMVTMLLGGLWHGANWTFVLWGGIHGLGLSVERFFGREPAPHRIPNSPRVWLQRLVIFSLVCLAWIFFRAKSIAEGFRMIGDLSIWDWKTGTATAVVTLAVLATVSTLMDLRLEAHDEEYIFQKVAPAYRVATATALLGAAVIFSASQANVFVYFQF
jgi:D-alanyl-lipoteichoic acid acyltransferase DltB (MBOAT superfamily)